MVDIASRTHSLSWARSIATLASPATSWGAFGFMPEGELHGSIPQLLALYRREFVQARTVLLHDDCAWRFLFNDCLCRFHIWFIPLLATAVKPTENLPGVIHERFGKGSGRTIDSRHWMPPALSQNVTLLTDPIANGCAIQRLPTVVSRRNRRAIFTCAGFAWGQTPKPTLGKLENKSYFRRMETNTIEQRMARIERAFDQLKHQVLDLKPRATDWRSTVGVMPDDELSRSAERLGREWREQANKE